MYIRKTLFIRVCLSLCLSVRTQFTFAERFVVLVNIAIASTSEHEMYKVGSEF